MISENSTYVIAAACAYDLSQVHIMSAKAYRVSENCTCAPGGSYIRSRQMIHMNSANCMYVLGEMCARQLHSRHRLCARRRSAQGGSGCRRGCVSGRCTCIDDMHHSTGSHTSLVPSAEMIYIIRRGHIHHSCTSFDEITYIICAVRRDDINHSTGSYDIIRAIAEIICAV